MINDKNIRLVRKADGDCVEEVVQQMKLNNKLLQMLKFWSLLNTQKQSKNIMVVTWIWSGA